MSYDISKMLSIAESEIGYLEKASNSNLDSKTGNAGYNNYTKYWRDLGLPGYQKQPWCNAFVNWCFVKAYGNDAAKSLLCSGAGWSYYTPTSAGYFKNKGQWYTSNPAVGDIIYFKSGSTICHVGIVAGVSGSTVTTIEGNTSSASNTVVSNGGGVFKKSYSISNARIAGYGRPNYGSQASSSSSTSSNLLKRGSSGTAVKELQTMLIACGYSCGSAGADGSFGGGTESALKAFQSANGLSADGVYGPASKAKLQSVYNSKTSTVSKPSSSTSSSSSGYTKTQFIREVQSAIGATVDGIAGPKTLSLTVTISKTTNKKHAVVLPVQKYLNSIGYNCGTADGDFGGKTEAAVIAYQKANGCTADGVITGKNMTWKKLLGLA